MTPADDVISLLLPVAAARMRQRLIFSRQHAIYFLRAIISH
jgi:hypothetical protein